MGQRLKFLLLEDEAVIARQVKVGLRELGDVEVAETLDAGLALLGDARRWSGFWIDVMLRKGCGLDVLEAARQAGARAPAFVASANLEDNAVLSRIFQLDGVPLPKPFRNEDIARFVGAVQEHLDQQAGFEDRLAARTNAWRTVSQLSAREAEIIARRARGESREAIADEMGVTPLTLKKHISNAMRKIKDDEELDLDAAVARLLRQVAGR